MTAMEMTVFQRRQEICPAFPVKSGEDGPEKNLDKKKYIIIQSFLRTENWYRYWCRNSVLWIRNFSLRIRIRLFNEFRIRILLVKSSGFGTDLFPDEIPVMILKVLKWRSKHNF
jgi:hypothetical protein